MSCAFSPKLPAPHIDVAAIVRRAEAYRSEGADVTDLRCLPSTPFPHLADAIKALRSEFVNRSLQTATQVF
ncbi:hypothetical protein [Candidatus Methylomicrobium oryzae]|jgi:hypothetical protein|uniref:hypothetical protein n=1 Tax=Candidatus Methylomicrobium oryzae TaxID=2802053 RepID=UPI001F256841|nr:hypothetical protein [Methylomicrobium sp. RS1]